MKKKVIVCILCICSLCLSACYRKQKKQMEHLISSVEKYYWDKYHEKVEVIDSELNGLDGLFGFSPNGDYTYTMEDGTTVYYIGSDDRLVEEMFPDNNLFINELEIGEYQHGKGFTLYYDGDTTLSQAKNFCDKARKIFINGCTIHLFGISNSFDLYQYPSMDDEGYFYEIKADVEDIRVKRPSYIQIMDGLEVTSNSFNLELNEDDLQVVEILLEEIQKFIDEAYDSLPYEADDGSRKDQVHEGKDILLQGKAFKFVFSDRLKSNGSKLDVYFRINPDLLKDGNTFYYAQKGYTKAYTICTSKRLIRSLSIKEDNYYFIGTTERIETGPVSHGRTYFYDNI